MEHLPADLERAQLNLRQSQADLSVSQSLAQQSHKEAKTAREDLQRSQMELSHVKHELENIRELCGTTQLNLDELKGQFDTAEHTRRQEDATGRREREEWEGIKVRLCREADETKKVLMKAKEQLDVVQQR